LEKGGMLNEAETLREVTEALASVAKVAGPITMDTHILHDLNLDSVAVMDLVMVLETRFDTVIPMDRLAEIETVGDLVRMLSHLEAPAGGG
jgi:acyl carrier protein